MDVLKYIAIAVILVIVGMFVDLSFGDPLFWHGAHRRESIRILSAAKTPQELRAAVGKYGAFIEPTNGGWVAIRYTDTHSGSVQSMTVVRDSDGKWFESRRHFCGVLQNNASNSIADYLRLQPELPDAFPTQTNAHGIPSPDQLIPLFHATNVDAARKQLLTLGFKEFPPPRP